MEERLYETTPTANTYLFDENGVKKIRKVFSNPILAIDRARFDVIMNTKLDLIVKPERLIIEDGYITGYVTKFIDGVNLKYEADNINFDKIISGIAFLGAQFDLLENIEIGKLDSMDMVYSGGKIYYTNIDNFAISKIPNSRVVQMKNIKSLKEACISILPKDKLTSDINKALETDMKAILTPAYLMLKNFKNNASKLYDFDTLGKLKNEIGGNFENNSNSRTYGRR